MPEWTPWQENAINSRNSNILVSAAAGSGKTAVLVQRVIDLICDENLDAGIDKLLIVTFTNAAAAEMKSRISSALREIIKEDPNNSRAAGQLALLPCAKISTIDTFCINLARENFFKLDISQDFSILDDSQRLIVEQNAMDEVLERHYQLKNEDFKGLIELISSSKDDENLAGVIKKISGYIGAQAFPDEWLDEMCELYNPDISIDESRVRKYVFSQIGDALNYFRGIIDDCILCLDADEYYDKYCALLEKDTAVLDSLEELLNGSWDDMKIALENVAFDRTVSTKRDYTGASKQMVANRRDLYKKELAELSKLMTVSAEDFERDNKYLYPKIKYLCALVGEYNQKMLEIKKEMNAYTFSDTEHFAIELLFGKENGRLVKTDLAKEYEGRFYEILVDEYQDTNSAQDTVFEMLSNGKNRFMVGDIKQSIYRFRLAMPDIFNSKKDSFADYAAASGEINQKIILDKNFRSRKGICDYTNFVFSNLMSKEIGGLEYGSEDYLYGEGKYAESEVPCAQMKILTPPKGEDALRYEAMHIAQLIQSKIQAKEQIKEKDEYRDIRYSDFAVLLRYTKNKIDTFYDVFREYAIPVSAINKSSLFDNNEVSILVSLLKVIDNPSRDVPLLATLMSVFYGYTADDIAAIRVNNKKESLYASVCKNREKFGAFLDDIEKYRQYASSMSIESFLRQLISSTSYLSLISAMGNAEQRRLNVMKFLELARNFDNGENVGITAFMRYIDSVISSKVSLDGASVVHSKENCVSIMTVHQSKGLEFPVVIYANTSHKYNDNDLKDNILLNYKEGIGFKVYDEKQMIRFNSQQYEFIRDINLCDGISENLRLLYVAITRAKEQFISFVTLSETKNKLTRVKSLAKKLVGGTVAPFAVKHIQNDGDLLLLTALLHRDSKELREYADCDVAFDSQTDFALDVELAGEAPEPECEEEEKAKSDKELVEEIKNRLSFEYERRSLSSFSSKRSASELDERERGFKFFAKSKPAFLSKSELTAAQKGTAMHAFMQFCSYENAKEDIEAEISRLVDNSYLSALQAASLNREKLCGFFSSDFAKRMFESDAIYREIKVASFVKASELEQTQYEDEILVQGIADCVFEENGELVLVDYKTDYVSSEEELLDLYKNQIAFYKKAVSKSLNKPVKEAMLYSFCLEKPCLYK